MAEPIPENTERTGNVGYKNPPVETRFPKGVSGNPGGRPKGLSKAIRDIPKETSGESAAVLLARIAWGWVSDPNLKPELRQAAWKLIAAYGYGNPPQHAPMEDADPLETRESMEDLASRFDLQLDELATKREQRAAADLAKMARSVEPAETPVDEPVLELAETAVPVEDVAEPAPAATDLAKTARSVEEWPEGTVLSRM